MTDRRERWELAESVERIKTEVEPPFLGMDSFHLLAWMHDGRGGDRARPADVLIREVWNAAVDAAVEVVTRR